MQARRYFRLGILVPFAFVLSSCETGPSPGSNSFRSQYSTARDALETGRYDRANRIYIRLLEQAGPVQPRIRLEYSHSLLRDGNYNEATNQAQILSQTQTGTARSAAPAVLGSAQHELALAAILINDRDAGQRHLIAAQNAIGEVLRNDPELDPLGSLAGRQASIKVQLASLR